MCDAAALSPGLSRTAACWEQVAPSIGHSTSENLRHRAGFVLDFCQGKTDVEVLNALGDQAPPLCFPHVHDLARSIPSRTNI